MWRIILLSIFVFWSCNPSYEERFYHEIPSIPMSSDRGEQASFPGPKLFPDEVYQRFERLLAFEEVFEFDEMIRLENTESSTFGDVTDIFFQNGHWFVLDKMTHAVYKFRRDGGFVQRFGRYGEGPGEFASPMILGACFNGNLSICDPTQGKIHVYDEHGTYITTTNPSVGNKTIMPRFGYVWPQKDRLYLAAFGSMNPDAPQHVALKYQNNQWSVDFGFGKRIESIQLAVKRGAGLKPYTAFSQIGDRLWTGSPFTTHLEVFTLDGGFLGKLGKSFPRDPTRAILPSDIEDIHLVKNPDEKMRLLVPKSANKLIAEIGDLVVVQLGAFLDFYDKNGNPLLGNVPFKPFSSIFVTGDRLIMVVMPGTQLEWLSDPDLREAVKSVQTGEEDNPYLAVYKLRENLSHQM